MTTTLTDWSARANALADALSVPDGGFTIDPRDGSDVHVGYAVAVHPEYGRIFDHPVTSDGLVKYIAYASAALALPGRVFGGWCDPATGRIYLDVSVVTTDLTEAITLARNNGQLAIFDLSAMESISVAAAA